MSRRSRRNPNGRGCASAARTLWLKPFMAEIAVPTPSTRVSRRLEVWLPLVVLALDQITKELVRRSLELHESVTVIPGLVDFTYVRNTGAAFGILNSADFAYKTVIIVIIATAGLVGVAVYSASLASHQLAPRIGLALIIGGAAGNLVDRVLVGYV